jgi:hypothetical protein
VSTADAIVLGLSVLLLGWIGYVLVFLRDRLSRFRPFTPARLIVGPLLYGLAAATILRSGLAIALPWAVAAIALGALVALLRNRGTRLAWDAEAGKRLIATSPAGLASIAVIALVQPVVIAARALFGSGFNEAAVHQGAVLFLLALSVIYAALVAARLPAVATSGS